MPERAKFPCPHCGERISITELQLLYEPRLEIGCGCCGYEFAIDNPVPAALEGHFQAARDSIRKPIFWAGPDRRRGQCL
jgi:hypothetical protein